MKVSVEQEHAAHESLQSGRRPDRGAHNLASHDAAQSESAHQSFNRASRCLRPFARQLAPNFVSAIDLHVGLPDALDLRLEHIVALSTGAALLRVAPKRGIPSISRRGDLQNLADRLDPESIAMLVDELP